MQSKKESGRSICFCHFFPMDDSISFSFRLLLFLDMKLGQNFSFKLFVIRTLLLNCCPTTSNHDPLNITNPAVEFCNRPLFRNITSMFNNLLAHPYEMINRSITFCWFCIGRFMLPKRFPKKPCILNCHAACHMILIFIFQVFDLFIQRLKHFPDCLELHFRPFQVAEMPLVGKSAQSIENLFFVR